MEKMALAALRHGIEKKRFAVFGRVGIDLSVDTIGVKTVDASGFKADLGGSAANIAAGLVKLGSRSALMTAVSDDAIGRFCTQKLADYGVNADHVRVVAGEVRTSLAIYESVVEGFENVIYRNNAADFQVTRADVDAVDLTQFGALLSAGTVFAAEPSRDAHLYAFAKAKSQGIPVIFDIDYRPYSWPSPEVAADVLSRAGALSDMIVGNDEEFGFMAGGFDQGLDMARKLSELSAALVVYKMGPHGAITFAEGEEIPTGIYPVEAIKPVGAGDSFMAGLLAAMADGHNLRTAILRGSACASIVVAHEGCAPAMPATAALEEFLNTHAGPTSGPTAGQITGQTTAALETVGD